MGRLGSALQLEQFVCSLVFTPQTTFSNLLIMLFPPPAKKTKMNINHFLPGLLEALIEHWRASLIAVFDVGRDLELGNTKTDAMRKRKREKQENSTKGLRW